MKAPDVRRAVTAGVSTAAALGLTVSDAIVVHDSNMLTLRLLPCDVLARVAPGAQQVAQFEIEVAQRLAESGSPVAALEPRVAPRAYERDGFVVTLWTYYEPAAPREVSPAGYADALARLHAGMRELGVPAPRPVATGPTRARGGGAERASRTWRIQRSHRVGCLNLAPVVPSDQARPALCHDASLPVRECRSGVERIIKVNAI